MAARLVILDLMLPHVDVEQLAAALRRVGGLASIPIIVVSASRAAGEAGARLGATAALRKPFDLFELTQRVNDWCPEPGTEAAWERVQRL